MPGSKSVKKNCVSQIWFKLSTTSIKTWSCLVQTVLQKSNGFMLIVVTRVGQRVRLFRLGFQIYTRLNWLLKIIFFNSNAFYCLLSVYVLFLSILHESFLVTPVATALCYSIAPTTERHTLWRTIFRVASIVLKLWSFDPAGFQSGRYLHSIFWIESCVAVFSELYLPFIVDLHLNRFLCSSPCVLAAPASVSLPCSYSCTLNQVPFSRV